jgi:hypothetical protein
VTAPAPTTVPETSPTAHETAPVRASIAVASVAVAPIAVVKVIATVLSAIKSYYDYLTAPDVAELERRLASVQRQIYAVQADVAALKALLYGDAQVEIEAKVASADEDFGVYLRTSDEDYLISAKASALEAALEAQAKPYTWYAEIDTYLRAVAIRIKWYQVAEVADPALVPTRKTEMAGHATHIVRLVSYLSATADGLVPLTETRESDTTVKPPIIDHYFTVLERDENGATVPGTARWFYVENRNRARALAAAEAYRATLLGPVRARLSIPVIESAAARCAALS